MRISDWSSDVCSSDLLAAGRKSTLLPSGLEFPRTVPRQQMLRVRLPPLRSPLSQLNSVFLTVKRQVEGQPPELADTDVRSEEHTSELQSLMRISYAVFCLKKKNNQIVNAQDSNTINPTLLSSHLTYVKIIVYH